MLALFLYALGAMMKKVIATVLVLAGAALLARIASPAVAKPNQVACNVVTIGTDVTVKCTDDVPYRVNLDSSARDGNVTATVTF